MDNNKLLIIIIIVILIFVISKRILNEKIVDKFSSGDLLSGRDSQLIERTIESLVNKRFSNLKLEEALKIEEQDDNISTFFLDLDAPIGMISHFFGNPNPENELYWIECNGITITDTQFPEFFDKYNEATGKSVNKYTLPNIVGRTIVGAGNISNPDSITNKSRNYGSNTPFNFNQDSFEFENEETGGYDVCPKNKVKTLSRAALDETNAIPVCTNMSNMPPHIYMTAWMKVKNKRFKVSF
jgi:hypothetical protein